ncbi:MAG TPA: hypothetical protein VMV92_00565 [Streptosporangiaceae bacterium]|nr:hypothetical protein [Streptosporangiaceae bacterium]
MYPEIGKTAKGKWPRGNYRRQRLSATPCPPLAKCPGDRDDRHRRRPPRPRPGPARLLAIVSDTFYTPDETAGGQQRITRLAKSGCGVIILQPATPWATSTNGKTPRSSLSPIPPPPSRSSPGPPPALTG